MKITYIVGIAKYHALVNRCAAGHLRLVISSLTGKTTSCEIWVQIPSNHFSGYCGVRCFNHFTKNNIKPAWVGANKTTPKYGHYSTMGESEISGATTLGTSLATRCKYKSH